MADKLKPVVGILLLILFLNFFYLIPQFNISISADENIQLESLAVSLIIDQSGSMSETDPENMRMTAANILIDLLSPEDHLGIISFSSESVEIHGMSNVGETTKAVYKSSLLQIGEASGDTDYVEAFEKARLQLESLSEISANKVIIFLTDGDPDPDQERREEAGFMDDYMQGLWDKVIQLGSSQYRVYTVGLGALNMNVLNRIALETQGSSALYAEPSEVASAFFDIVSTIKNRSLFMENEEAIEGEKVFEFTMENYISQETFLIRNLTGEMDVQFVPPVGVSLDSVMKMEKAQDYTLVTINQTNGEGSGAWQMKLTGNSELRILGSKDMFAKLWIEEPVSNTQQPIGEPLNIIASLTGIDDEELEITGIVKINGVQSLTPLKITESEGRYYSSFADTVEKGTYEITLNALKGDTIIASTTTEVYLRLVPVLTSDLNLTGNGYLVGEKRNVTSALSVASVPLKGSSDISVEYYELIKTDSQGNETSYILNDDGEIESGDAKSDDGQYSGVIVFENAGVHMYTLRARGIYQGELFILERPLGKMETYSAGSVEIRPADSDIMTTEGKDIYLTFRMTSTSPFQEIVSLSVNDSDAQLSISSITLDPMESKDVQVMLIKNNLTNGNAETLSVSATLGQPLTELRADDLNFSILQTSVVTRFISKMREISDILIIIIVSILIILLLIYAAGMFFYHKNFKRRYLMDGNLYILNEKRGDHGEEQVLDLYSYKNPKTVITFNENHKADFDFLIKDTRYSYDIIFEKYIEKGRFKFMDGYRSLKMSKKTELVYIRTTSPGILIVEGEVYTNAEVLKSLVFSSGEHHFRYERKSKFLKDEGKNILEGKM